MLNKPIPVVLRMGCELVLFDRNFKQMGYRVNSTYKTVWFLESFLIGGQF